MNDAALQPGGRLSKYRIERQLGRGGMGAVFLARDESLERPAAIKVLESAGEGAGIDPRLLREARNASSLNHPNICTVFEVGEHGGLTFIAMEYVEGSPLSELVAGGALPIDDAVRHAIEAADALAHAHDRGVVHRDLKAANAIVSSSGRLKIVDFGLARRMDAVMTDATTHASAASAGGAVGTPYAMAPEQVRGLSADARTDVWALGVLLFEMLAAARPFTGATVADVFSAILRDPPAPLPPRTPEPLREIVRTCLAKDPELRYQRAADVRLVLEVAAARLRDGDSDSRPTVPPGAPPPPSPLLGLAGASRLVGRERELAQMEHAWTRATNGERQLLLLAGEPGIGKTRLSIEFARRCADASATVLVGRCDEEALVPYQPFVEALTWYVRECPTPDLRGQLAAAGGGGELGPLIPDLLRRVPDLPSPSAMNPEGQRFRLFEAVAALLAHAARAHPILLVLDDLHWADKATLLMLRHVVRASDRAPLCVAGTYREGEVGRAHPLAEMLADLRRDRTVTRLSLVGLDEDQVRGLIGTLAGLDAPGPLSRIVVNATGGNPFFVTEVVRHLAETGAIARMRVVDRQEGIVDLGLPEGVKEVIGRRVSRLSEACNRTLHLAAVVGREFDIDVLEALGDLSEDALLDAIEEGVQSQLIAETPGRAGRFTFVHALIRETLYGGLTTTRRVRLHRKVGEALERLAAGRSDPPLADLAYHFVQALSPEVAHKAIDYATRAGDRAADALAHEEAARLYDLALRSLDVETAGPEANARRSEIHARRARAFGALGQWALEKAEVERSLEHLDPLHVERRCELVQLMASAAFYLLDLVATKRFAGEAVELAERVNRPDIAAKALGWLAACRQAEGDLGGAIETYGTAIAHAGRRRTEVYPIGPLSLYLAGRSKEAMAWGGHSAELARSSRDAEFRMFALSHFALVLTGVGHYAEAARVFNEAREFGRKYGVVPLLARATALSAGLHLNVFDFEGAEALQREAREMAASVNFPPPVVSAGIDLLFTFARQHDPGRGETLLRETEATAASTAGWHGWLWQLRLSQARAELAFARGAFDAALVEANAGIGQSRARKRPKYEALGLMTRARALYALSRTRDAIADARLAVDAARRTGDPALLIVALDTLLALDGDDAVATEARETAARISAALPDETIRRRFAASEVVRRVARSAPDRL